MKTKDRKERLMPSGVPRYVRCYDNQGESLDRYTVCFTGRIKHICGGGFDYLSMNSAPFHPQGIGQHGRHDRQIDVNKHGFAPVIGRKNHLGVRIAFKQLPPDCRKLVLQDYKAIWDLK